MFDILQRKVKTMGRVLVVDDEKSIVKGIRFFLEKEGMIVDSAYDGEEALNKIKDNDYDVILLDVMLPVIDGFSVCRQVREFSDVPIIMLTAKEASDDKINGLNYGADDYITKPFVAGEVVARIKAVLRRNSDKLKKYQGGVITDDKLKLDNNIREFSVDGKVIELTSKEFDLVYFLVRNKGKVYSRDELLRVIWGFDFPGDARTVDVHIRRIRGKIEEDPSEPEYIKTKWGFGYYYGK